MKLAKMALMPLFFIGTANATVITFDDFADTSLLTLNGDAQTLSTSDGTVLRLTREQTYSHPVSGSAFSTATINASNFSTYFQFRITNPGGVINDAQGQTGADGLVFVVQNVSSSIGGGGGGIGYSGIPSSVGVEFDTWFNSGLDPNSNHIGINQNGSTDYDNGPTLNVSPGFDNGDIWHSWIDYNGTSLEVRLSTDSNRPTDAALSQDLDISSILGQDNAYVGFTSGTYAAWGNHDILTWEYRDSYDPITGEVPEPSILVLLGAGLAGLGFARRRKQQV